MKLVSILLLALALTGADRAEGGDSPKALGFEAAGIEVPCPAGRPSGEPNLLRGADGRLYLSWIERGPSRRATLKFSFWKTAGWSQPRTIATGNDWFVNWADFPSLSALADGTLVAHWLQKSSSGTYSYDVKLSLSHNRGQSWSPPLSPHRDGTPTEHGFVSIIPVDKRTFGVFWLDGRKMVKEGGEMALRYCTLGRDGSLGPERVVDPRVCECCQTGAVLLSSGNPYVVFRDRSAGEVRDIGSSILNAGQVRRAGRVNADNWVIEGCPVNGPSVDTRGKSVAVAWFTDVSKHPEVRVRFSRDSAKTFGKTIRVDDGGSAGRVDIVLVDTNIAAVSWLKVDGKAAEIRWRVVHRDGTMTPPRRLTRSLASRSSGFPRMERLGNDLFFAWTDADKPSHVRTARWNR